MSDVRRPVSSFLYKNEFSFTLDILLPDIFLFRYNSKIANINGYIDIKLWLGTTSSKEINDF